MFFDPRAEPVTEIAPGERIAVETADSLCGLVKREAPAGFAIDDVVDRLGGACPVTGPIHVTGAEPGGVVEVHIERRPRRPGRWRDNRRGDRDRSRGRALVRAPRP
jgi:acetamidase/formamidase